MKKLLIILLVLTLIAMTYPLAKVLRNATVVDQPTEISTKHFQITYQHVYTGNAKDVAEALEENYDRIRTDLGDVDHKKVRVFIHGTQEQFNQATGLINSHANGVSRGPHEFHVLWTNWFNSIFPDDPLKTAQHEFTHCVQLNILIEVAKKEMVITDGSDFNAMFEEKFARDYPQWFWEAICDYEAGIVNSWSVNYGISNHPTLASLNNSNQAYTVGYTIIEYIVAKWGADKIPALVLSYGDIGNVLGVTVADFEAGWIKFVEEKY